MEHCHRNGEALEHWELGDGLRGNIHDKQHGLPRFDTGEHGSGIRRHRSGIVCFAGLLDWLVLW